MSGHDHDHDLRGGDDWRLRVCLERTLELAAVRLRVQEWPGLSGPLVHVPDPFSIDERLAEALAHRLAPRYRVLSLRPRVASPYQVDASDLLALLDQFGFETPVLVAEGLGCVAALLVAAWHPGRVAGLVLVDPRHQPPASDALAARALGDCPPDWPSLRQALQCPVLETQPGDTAVERIVQLVAQLGSVVT